MVKKKSFLADYFLAHEIGGVLTRMGYAYFWPTKTRAIAERYINGVIVFPRAQFFNQLTLFII